MTTVCFLNRPVCSGVRIVPLIEWMMSCFAKALSLTRHLRCLFAGLMQRAMAIQNAQCTRHRRLLSGDGH